MSPSTVLPVLNARFSEPAAFRAVDRGYALLPMRLIALDADRYVLTNFAGEYAVLPKPAVRRLVRHELDVDSPEFDELASKHFVMTGDSDVALDLLAVKYRTKQSLLANFTSLFMFVVSLRCDHSCPYCQVSRQSADRHAYDMTPETAERAVDFMFRSPSPALKVEFQGGESLLNFPVIRHIVERVEARNSSEGRDVQFVIATNLAPLTDEMLDFCREHEVFLSTSLDGPKALHNQNRPRPGGDSYELAVSGIEFYREALGHVIRLNLEGMPIREEYSGLILRKMLTPYPTGYVDLQSPAGIGIAGLVFNYDGDVYASDEARMLAETGDKSFRLGNLASDSFEDVMFSDRLLDVLSSTMTEGVPMCSDCGFQPYCGSDPVFHHATQGDAVGCKPTSDFCRKNMGVMRHLIRLLEDDPQAADVLKGWI